MNQLLYVVIPIHNRKGFTRDCLNSLRSQTYKNFKIVVIDDGSTDGSSEMIRNEFPEVHIIKGDGNLWWTAATNLGIKFALDKNAEYILTLNNDTIADRNFLEEMVYWAEKIPKAIFGALAIDANSKKAVYGGEVMNWKFDSSKKLLIMLNEKDQNGIHKVSHFNGRGLLIPREVFREIGYFDEKMFPHYGADNDFTMKAKRNKYEIYCNYDARLMIFPEENGGIPLRRNKNIRNYFSHLFDRKGDGNLIVYYRFTIRNCPPIFLPQNLLIGTLRRLIGYWVK